MSVNLDHIIEESNKVIISSLAEIHEITKIPRRKKVHPLPDNGELKKMIQEWIKHMRENWKENTKQLENKTKILNYLSKQYLWIIGNEINECDQHK